MTETKRRAAIYARISRDKRDDGATVKRQISQCRELAMELGLNVVAEFPEEDGTGASEKSKVVKRPQYDAMLEAARQGEFEAILAYSDDRLTRRPLELEELIKLVDKTEITIHTVRTKHYDLSTTQGITTARILGAVAAGEARTISDRQKSTFRDNALAGKPKLQRQRPFGWKTDGVTLEPSEAALIREGLQKILEGSTVTAIAREWEAAGVLTAAGNAKWEHGVLRNVLTGWRTAGIRTYRTQSKDGTDTREPLLDADGEMVRGIWEPIITLEERSLAIALLQKHARIKKRQGKWPLSGLLSCAECAKALYGQLPSGRRTRAMYACKNGHVSISAGLLEQLVIKELLNHIYAKQSNRHETKPEQPKTAEDWPQHARLVTVGKKISELLDAYNSDQLPASRVFAQVNKLDEEQSQLERELEVFLAQQAELSGPMRNSADLVEELLGLQGQFMRTHRKKSEEWENQPWGASDATQDEEETFSASSEEVEELNQLLKRELETIVVKKGVRGRTRASEEAFAERVDIVWR